MNSGTLLKERTPGARTTCEQQQRQWSLQQESSERSFEEEDADWDWAAAMDSIEKSAAAHSKNATAPMRMILLQRSVHISKIPNFNTRACKGQSDIGLHQRFRIRGPKSLGRRPLRWMLQGPVPIHVVAGDRVCARATLQGPEDQRQLGYAVLNPSPAERR